MTTTATHKHQASPCFCHFFIRPMLLGSLLLHGLVFMIPMTSQSHSQPAKAGEKTEIKSERATHKTEAKSQGAAEAAKTNS